MTSMQFVIQPLPGTDEQFLERLREVSDKVNKYGFGSHRIFEQLKIQVKEVVIGPNHIGVLLEDGKAFRVAFSINSERLDLSKPDLIKNNISSATNNSNNVKNNAAPGSSRQLARSRARLMRTTGRTSSGGQGSGSRSTGVIIGGSSSSRPLVTVPATYVPEELISQAEVVLQGKSRNLIIRELQRTNLDVNLAVNNLLSRDDEEADDTEESGDNYVPEDLISLLDNGFHAENSSVIIDPSDGLFSEEIFSNYSSIRNLLFDRIRSERNQTSSSGNPDNQSRPTTSASGVLSGSSSLSAQISSVNADREAFSRWRDRQYYGPRRWLNKEEYTWEKDSDIKKKEQTSMPSPIWISEELQPWPDKSGGLKFKKIAALYSELIGLSETGEVHQWRWNDLEPYKSEADNFHHPKVQSFGLTERVEHISANFIRCSIVTESNRVATWMDEQLGYLGAKIEHGPTNFPEFTADPIISIQVCSLYTAVKTENNSIYWWGVLPFDQRRYLWDKFRTKTKKPFKTSSSDITVGMQVVMKKCPIYQMGSIGFTCVNGVPKVGQLLNSVWDFNDVCRFKIWSVLPTPPLEKLSSNSNNTLIAEKETTKVVVTLAGNNLQSAIGATKTNTLSTNKESADRIDMPPPPSPASSTCSDTGGSASSHKRNKRLATKDDIDGKKDEELWQLKDVVFVEDKIGPIGKVLKVDGDFVAVRFPAPNSAPSGINVNDGKEDDWQQCRLLRREDVQIYKTAISSRGPDCLQKTPKKINISHGNESSNFQLLAFSVDTRGIHVIKKVSSKLYYSLYNLYNSKQEQNSLFPTDSISFMGSSINNITMHCNNDCSGNASTIFLRDGNRAIYPLAKDCVGSIKDPQWLDLPPIKGVSMATISLSPTGNNLKSKICLTAILFETQKFMPHILRCDIKNAIAILNLLEKGNRNDISSILEERCDGGRNIFHACTIMCSPTSNKDSEEKKCSLSSRTSANPAFSNTNSTSGNDNCNTPGTNSTASFATISNISYSNREGRTVNLREMMINRIDPDQSNSGNGGNTASNIEDHFYAPPWSTESGTNSSSSINDTSLPSSEDDAIKISTSQNPMPVMKLCSPIYTFDPIQRREHATLILQHMCSTLILRPFLLQMLSAKDAQGQTPFMLSVFSRAYEAGIILLNTILTISENDTAAKDSMIFPHGSPPDQSPLHVICYNDTCSFTWTGADHINQNIFECKTCGLTGSLCCCTECARVCHKGHDCKLKRTSPTAYCDCWEKCKCKALIAGNQNKRFTLLCKLAACTDLVTKFNSKGESILLFLIQTVGRQMQEQRQYRAASSRIRNVSNSGSAPTSSRKASSIETDADMPEHNLEPPKFAREALERLLNDWNAVKAMIMTGTERFECANNQVFGGENYNSENYNIYLQTQQGSTLLDKFTHNLFVKCSSEHLDTLLKTLVREMQNDFVEDRITEAEDVARRFVRSVGRVFVIFNLEKLPNPERRKSNITPNKHIQNCIKVFQTLYKISIQELCEISEAVIAPVRLGVVRPTAPFAMSSSSLDNSDDLFSVEPLAPTNTSENVIEPIASHDTSQDQTTGFNLQPNYGIDGLADNLREVSENEETSNRESNTQAQDEEMLEANRNDDGIQDDESDNDFPFNDAETESDSDDNQSNQDAQRSVQTGATAGSETDIGVLFLEDESGDSSAQDDDASEDGETDEHSDEFNFADHQLERRNVNSNSRSDVGLQSMQWAIRSRDTSRSSVRVPPGSSLVFIDPMALRRSTVPASSTVTTPPQEQHTMATTASNLARAFGIIIRQISELFNSLSHNLLNDIEMPLEVQTNEAVDLQAFVEKRFKPTWDWMFSIMDGTEAQLKFGAYLTNYTDPTHPLHPLHPLNLNIPTNTSQTNPSTAGGVNTVATTSRREFFTYCLSLMRSHTSEHRDALPVLDITALRHISYVLDGLLYYMRNDANMCEKMDTMQCGTIVNAENDETDDELLNISIDENYAETTNPTFSNSSTTLTSKKHAFFIRSESTLSLGCLAPDGFDLSLDVAMPLADKPHLLQPNSKREDLFANLPLPISTGNFNEQVEKVQENVLNYPPTKLGFSNYVRATVSQKIEVPQEQAGASTMFTKPKDEPDVNIYVQLKKKQFIDGQQSELDKKSVTKNDLSVTTSHGSVEKLEENLSMDTDENTDLVASRPKVIVTPTKTQQEAVISPTCSAVRSVIVRAGTSNQKQEEILSSQQYTYQDEVKDSASKVHAAVFSARGSNFCSSFTSDSPSWNFLLGRWKLTLDLFGRVFMDDVGMENGSILPELRGFPVKEMRFRRHMEKLRNGQQRDLILCKLERNRDSLIIQTFKELNTQFGNQSRRGHPPLTFNRVKVTFKDEPGEGSGVARSFYTSISEALLDGGKIPNLESVQVGNNSKYGVPFSSILRKHGPSRPDMLPVQRRGTGSKILWRTARERKNLNYDAKPYVPSANNSDNSTENPNDHLSVHLQQLGERLLPKIYSINSTHASKITGMLLEIPTPQLLSILSSEETLRQKVNEALELINIRQKSEASNSSIQSKKNAPLVMVDQCQLEDNEPLFYSPGKRGFYTPRQGYGSFERINAFRNIGRLIGLCLLQNELLPLFLQRHVLKYILNRKIKFHDLAFFDPLIYESFRQLILSSQLDDGDDIIARMDLNFIVDLMKEEGGGSAELTPGGREVQVTSSNLYEYIRRYTEYRLIKSQEKALEALKDGVFDVLPENCMSSLTAEDLRLLLNGVGDINVSTLISYTTFNDESSEGADKLLKFKRWFWSIVEKMNTMEKQDLVYFWTGSPALPASEEGFQPLPSVTIRPADDTHLPTANTCISRLYIPLYSSKSILRSKLLLAIKSKNFGFV